MALADSGDGHLSAFTRAGNFALLGHCTKCHNSEDWAGGIAFDTMPTDDVAANAETWEKVVRKLRGRLMPPPNAAQPDQHAIDSFVGFMENSLDHAPAADPGNVSLHRLNRTEYGREIKRILGLDIDAGNGAARMMCPAMASTTSRRCCAPRRPSSMNSSPPRAMSAARRSAV